MNINKLYECLSIDEQTVLINIVVAELSKKKTDILVFIELYKDDLIHSLKLALRWAYLGRYHNYRCTYIEDLEMTEMANYSGMGHARIMKLEYLIKKHKNRKQ